MTPFRHWFGVMAQGMQPHWRRSPAPRIPQGYDGKRAVSYMLPGPERILQGPLWEDQGHRIRKSLRDSTFLLFAFEL